MTSILIKEIYSQLNNYSLGHVHVVLDPFYPLTTFIRFLSKNLKSIAK